MNSIENTLHSSTGHFKINIQVRLKVCCWSECGGWTTPEVHGDFPKALTGVKQKP